MVKEKRIENSSVESKYKTRNKKNIAKIKKIEKEYYNHLKCVLNDGIIIMMMMIIMIIIFRSYKVVNYILMRYCLIYVPFFAQQNRIKKIKERKSYNYQQQQQHTAPHRTLDSLLLYPDPVL